MSYRIIENVFGKHLLQVQYSYLEKHEKKVKWKTCAVGTREHCENVYKTRTGV